MSVMAVTGFIPIPGHPRPAQDYERLGAQLAAADITALLRLDTELEACWLYRHLQRRGGPVTHSTADNPAKNSLAYHIVQAQKSELVAEAAELAPGADVIVWIDLGIFHLPGMTTGVIEDFMARADGEETIAIPGCWEGNYQYDDRYPCWRFCGGLMVVPRERAAALAAVMRDECKRHLRETGNLSWEINTLARVEARYPELPIRWYGPCNHDASMFLNYRATEHADGWKAQGLRGVQG
jgi:hypothetical protein